MTRQNSGYKRHDFLILTLENSMGMLAGQIEAFHLHFFSGLVAIAYKTNKYPRNPVESIVQYSHAPKLNTKS